MRAGLVRERPWRTCLRERPWLRLPFWEQPWLRSGSRAHFRWFALALLLVLGACEDTHRPLSHEAYVWQHRWDDALRVALARPQPAFSGLRVLALEVVGSRPKTIAVDLGMLAQAARPLRLVVRIEGALPPSDARTLAGVLNEIVARWRGAGITLAGIEIDHDCATARLAEYAHWLRELRSALSLRDLSITALPTWIESPALPALLATVDHSVLQVHAIDPEAHALLSVGSARAWAWAYAQIAPHAFYLAVPAYGLRVEASANGRPVNVDAEGDVDTAGSGGRELRADPQELARLLADLKDNPPPKLAGYVWFRLPVTGDRRSWSAASLAAVMAAAPLRSELRVAVEHAEAGASDLIVENHGSLDRLAPISIELPDNCGSADGLGAYRLYGHGDDQRLSTTAPPWLRVGEGVRIGWARCEPQTNTGWILDASNSSS